MGRLTNVPTGTAAATVSGSNSSAGGDAFTGVAGFVYLSGGGMRAAAPSGQAQARWALPSLETKIKLVTSFIHSATPAGDLQCERVTHGTTLGTDVASAFLLSQLTSNALRLFVTGTGSSAEVWTSSGTLTPGTKYRRVIWADMAARKIHAALYADGATQALTGMDSGVIDLSTLATPRNLGPTSGSGFINSTRGKYDGSSTAYSGNIDIFSTDVYYGADATDDNGIPGAVVPTVTGVMSPASADTGVERTLTLTMANPGSGAVTWGPMNWGDGLTNDPAVTTAAGVTQKIFKRIPSGAGLGRGWSCPWSQA